MTCWDLDSTVIDPETVPVSVALKPGCSTAVTVPSDTALFCWCRLRPWLSTDCDSDHRRVTIRRALSEGYNPTLHVAGNRVGILEEPLEDGAVAYWTVMDSPGSGTHEISFTLTPGSLGGSNETDIEGDLHPPSVSWYDENTALSWHDRTLRADVEVEVIETDTPSTTTEPDPLWGRKDILTPIETHLDGNESERESNTDHRSSPSS